MARPRKNNADYFSHDAGMRNNRKVKALRAKFGLTGYAVWCMTLELLTESEDNSVELDGIEMQLIAGDFGVSVTEINQIWGFCHSLRMIDIENDAKTTQNDENALRILRSPGLDERLKPVYDKRKRAKEQFDNQRLERKKEKESKNINEVSVVEMTQSKVNKSKVNKKSNTKVLPKKTDPLFLKFWDLYANKVDRAKCEKKWEKISEEDKKIIFERLPAYLAATTLEEISGPGWKPKRKNPLTWLNGKCWNDEPPITGSVKTKKNEPRQQNGNCTIFSTESAIETFNLLENDDY